MNPHPKAIADDRYSKIIRICQRYEAGEIRLCEAVDLGIDVGAKEEREGQAVLVKGLADMASNFGKGSFSGSPDSKTTQRFRIAASETLRQAGYNYYECCGKDNIDGWFTKDQLQALKEGNNGRQG